MNDTELDELRTAFRKLSHDVRSPLTAILGLAEITLEDESLSADSSENLSLIVSDAERLTTLMVKSLDEIEARFFPRKSGDE
jgi:two-component system, chemotaxis family, CheB/CheR fusion protein